MRTKSPFVTAALAAAVSLVLTSSAFAAGVSAQPAAGRGPGGPLVGFEDESVVIPITLKAGQIALDVAPSRGLVVFTGKTPRYVPNADFSGVDSFVVKDAKGNVESFNVTIQPVNDPPSFAGGRSLGHAAGTRGAFTVPGWATAISVGPADEQLSQTFRFELEDAGVESSVVRSAWVDENGTLNYVLSGDPGVAEFLVRAVDSGGGSDTSKAQQVRIGVGQETDLGIKREVSADVDLDPWESYRLVVTNNGPRPVASARVIEVVDSGGEQLRWSCASYDGGSCAVASGEGPVDVGLAMKVDSVVVIEVTTRDPLAAPSKRTAFVVPDETMVDVNPSNNEIED